MIELLLMAVISGVLMGIIYGLIGIGMNILYGVMRIVNFAHGEFMMLGAYMAFTLNRLWGLNSLESIFVVLPLFFILGILLHALFYERIQQSDDPEIASFLTFFGISLVITSVILLIWKADPRGVPFPFSRVSWFIGPVFLPLGRLISAGVCALAIGIISVFLYRTYTGKAVRAIIENRDAVSILGIDVRRVSALVFGIGLSIVAITGCLVTLSFPAITPVQGQTYTTIAFLVIVLGGLGTPLGALLGGLVYGLAESVSSVFMPVALSPVVAFVILILMVMVRPQGLLGKVSTRI
ncbi:MAG: branched-chain amino acid ABC transporter permease [Deltaproteobacteria bacterium]|nr:branched-chain amino acid ABC transporter permease [Deltaproteobacteria bacterium]MBW1955234.1 branched-chain amino acid ABC transporter permease [Deltaproteobacteria bacterium]MBW2040953.1 branched-chain amino acid ABC transporter permease [Deltaproteobacteria bacterium]MBW2130951.1 branched-chain amino acid ABC transporter permease [Deltaproteobacteria bacterium]